MSMKSVWKNKVKVENIKLYWNGNIAKTKIIKEILGHISDNKEVLIFDYGCGDGGDWPAILSDFPNIKLMGYEPSMKSFKIANERLRGFNAEIFTGESITKKSFKADFIVSFSVLEHVYDKVQYLEFAKKHLADKGLFYLNYDDGHFRNYLDLTQPNIWFRQIKELLHNTFAEAMAKIGMISRYQRRVYRKDIDALIQKIGFKVLKIEYCNLISLKALQKTIPFKLQQRYSAFWLKVEDELNSTFCVEGNVVYGDTINLWQQMSSRILYLCHS